MTSMRSSLLGKTSSPDWDMVPFAVGCARCGQDLRSLTEPVCPACELDFSWADAVPIEQLTCLHCGYHLYGLQETRCPECGERFTWEKVLDDYRRRKKPLFEYQWRTKPLRSLVGNWWLVMRPWKLWRMIDIHDPPAVGPLLVMMLFCLVLSFLCLVFCEGLQMWLYDRWYWHLYPKSRILGSKPGFILFIHYFGPACTSRISLLPALVVWYATSLGALLIFQQSMRRYKVRTVHVVRVWVYAIPWAVPLETIPKRVLMPIFLSVFY